MKLEKYELTNPQKSIYLTDVYYKDTAVNTICGYVFIQQKVDLEILKKAINEMIKSNDGMRLKFQEENSICKQYVADYEPFEIDTVALSSKEDLEKKALDFANTPLALNNEFLFKFILFKLPNGSGGFIVNVHHLIGDSWSLGLIAKDVTSIYSSILDNTYKFEEKPSYVSYITAENEYKNSDKYQKDKAYWEDVFRTVPENASICPATNKQQKEITCLGERKKFVLDKNVLTSIKDFCDKNKISVYNFFMSVYSLYTSRISNLDDFVMGTPILNRTNFEQKHTMGMFISVAPLRVTVNEDVSFTDFAKKIAVDTMSIFRHQKYSYQTILEDLRKRESSLPNLYNIILSYQITKTIEDDSKLTYSTDWVFNGNCADELQIHLFDLNDENQMTIAYDYRASCFNSKDIDALHSRILTIIEQILSNNSILLKEIEIVTAEEKKRILYDFNNTYADYPRTKTIVDLFEEQVEKTPDNIAVVFEDQKLTYKELNEKANGLAKYLIENGSNAGDIIGLRLNKSLEMIIGILAIIKIGACYLPMNMAYPEDRVNYMLSDSNCKMVLTLSNLNDISYKINRVNIDLSYSDIYDNNFENINVKISPDDLLYIIYTSGSTGNPKGAMLTHKNVVRLMKNDKFLFDFDENDAWTMFHSVAFDFSVWEMYGALLYGGKLVLVPEDVAKDPKLFLALLRKENVTILNQTPTYFYSLQDAEMNIDTNDLKIRYIIFGGEALTPSLLQSWHKKYPDTKLINMYGITETTVHVTFKALSDEDLLSSSSNIGKPIPTLHVLILDKNKNLLPCGVEGEIYVLGDGVFKGYLNRPDLNEKKLVYLKKYHDGPIYKSDDSAIMHENGDLEYKGRIDKQVKVRGFRVELGEIEDKILKHSNIDKCIVCKKSDDSGREFLCAYFIKNGPINVHILKNVLAKDLPNYMIPQYFIEIEKVPININGKTDFNSLPLPEFIIEDEEMVMPETEIDKLIYKVYESVLGIKGFSMKSSFYDLGGDSLSAISISSKLTEKLHKNISVKTILENPILTEFSKYLEKLASTNEVSVIDPVEKKDYYITSNAQKRIYYASVVDSGSTLYNIAGGIITDKVLDINLLQKCLQTLIDRHEILRTHFEVKDNDIVQIIHDKIDFTLPFEKADTCDLNKIYESFVKPFDLAKAPLFRAKAIALPNGRMLILLDMHHIICDGASLSILLQELCSLYNGSVLPEKQVDYKDFCYFEKEQFEKDDFKQLKDFWVNQYKDEIPLLNMPTTYARPSVQSFEGSNYYTKLPKETFDKIEKTSKSLGVTPYMLLISAYYILLSKYTSQDDIVVGTPIANRDVPELSNMLGMFVNTLALRYKVNTNGNFHDLILSLKDYLLSAFENQAYPFDELVKELNIKRDTSRNSLFDVMFAYQSNGYPKINLNGTSTEYFIPDNNVSKFDLTLEIVPMNNELSLRFEYCTKLFDEDFIKRFSSHYINILNAILENQDVKIADIDMLSKEEKNQILNDFNDTFMDYPRDKTIVDLFEEQVEKTPDNIAVVFEDQKLTYKELNEKANQVATYLVENNVKIGDIVGIYLNKSLEVVISMFGILKAGAAFLPLDIDYPQDRLSYILNHAKPKVVLSSKQVVTKLANAKENIASNESSTSIILVDLDEKIFKEENKANLSLNFTPEELMYIMYTSGSTGNPKGVMVKHKNIIRLAAFPNFIKFSQNEVMVQTGTIVFDACIFEIFGSLLHGFKLYVLKKENILDIPFFTNFLEKEKVTILFLTTGLFNQLGVQNPNMFCHLKYLLTGGDVISKESIDKIKACAPNLKIINCYGPTENGSYSTCYQVNGNETTIPIGKPITNSTAYVMSNSGKLCPIGIPGELWVGGDGVARGYLNNPDLTQKQFIENPFGKGLIYKTGDLVKWLPDGNIEFLARMDNQIKIRGFRVELSEIDRTIISNSEDINQALTLLQVVNGSKMLCSYIVADNKIDTKKLRNILSKYLPIYMVPAFIIQMPAFPLNISGKIDMKAFPIPSIDDIEKDIVPARNELDATILSTLGKILNIDNISITDSFFDLGGDSLSAISFTNSLSQELKVLLTVNDVFKNPIIEDLSNYIASLGNVVKDTIKPVKKMDYYPTSSAQRRMYYASSIDSGSTLYNIPGGIVVDKVLDINLLQKCFQTLIDRHEILRTRFEIIDTDIMQIIEDKIDFVLPFEASTSNDLNAIYANFLKPFDLSKAPLFRAKAIALPNGKMLILLDMHHSICDGTSLGILLKELCELYNGNQLPEKQVDYKDFSIWENEQFKKDTFKNSKDFWVSQYKDEIPLLNMPTTYTRPSVQSFEGSNYYAKLPKETFEKIEQASKSLGVTPYMLLISVYYILLSKYTSQDDIVVGTPIVGRDLPELSNMLGMFVNSLALRSDVTHDSNFSDYVLKLKEYLLLAFDNQTYPFDELVKELNVKRDTSRNPLFDVMFIYQNNGYPKVNLKDTEAEYFIPDSNVSKFDLSLEIIPMDNELSLRFEYCTKLFDEDFIKRLSSHYINILNTILENQNVKIADIDMLSTEEKGQILNEFNDTYMEYPTNSNLLDLFSNVINSYPNNIAISNIANTITYNELDQKSNYLANELYSQGVRNGDVVGVCLNRSIELLISIWAILKLGATYMPMYIGYPTDRLNYMLLDSNAKILITNSALNSLFKNNKKIIIDSFLNIGNLDEFTAKYDISPNNNAYIIYTSGSTGKPKGVKISHRNLINFIYSFNTYYNTISPEDVFIASTNISFDVSIWELFMPLLNGAKLVLNTEEILTNIIDYCSLILSEKVTALYIPPNILNEVFELLNGSDNIKINKLLVGVESIKKETLNKFFELNNNMIIVNGYGPTETTICASALVYKKDLDDTSSFVSIGHPLFNNQIYILNDSQHLQPVGVPGEIYICGSGVGKGYINNIEANNQSFVKINNHVLYKTGDLAKWNNDGTINFIGRIDNQVKLNGYRIELNEINSVILSYPSINKCYTTMMKNDNRPYIVSYFTSDSNVTIKDLKAYLQTKLTFYMVPKFLIKIDAFPMTVNGKIDYKSLPVPNYESNVPFVAPRNDFEMKIGNILCNLLNLKEISIDDNFFDLGCDSIIAIKFQIEALKENIDISYGDIFKYSTIRLLYENKDNIKSNISFSIDANYDFTNINKILMKNKVNTNNINYKKTSKNTALLLGSTGFLGAHILDSYFTSNPNNTLYCIVRRKSLISPIERLKKTLNYYFGTKYDSYFIENKIVVIEGDICQKYFGLSIDQLNILMDNIDIIINSAALVKHYGDYETFSKINIEGTKSIVHICKEYNKKLYHVSTLSVSGLELANFNTDNKEQQKHIFDETSLYINQQFDNVYLYTKFEAEKSILEEIGNGLNATILRIGNLTNRFSDGMFQINVSENAFVNKLKSIINLKVIQSSFLKHAVELTPVDLCADAIIKIVDAYAMFPVLHIFNTKFVECTKLLEYINNFGYSISAVSDKDFASCVTHYLNTDNLKNSIAGIVTDLNKDKVLDYSTNIIINADMSNSFLHKLNFDWPILDETYFKKYLEFFEKINYFNEHKGE